MTTLHFGSVLAAPMQRFVALRRLAGSDYGSQTRLPAYFDQFLRQRHFSAQFLGRDILDRYLNSLSHLAVRSRYNRFCVVRQFCEYWSQFEPRCEVPEAPRSVPSTSSTIPYIYTDRQIRDLLQAAEKLPPSNSLRPHTYRTLFGLLYTTGLRIGEALALNLNDVYEKTQRLHIREGKFRKARWIPLSVSTAAILQQYCDQRQKAALGSAPAPLFISLKYRRLHHSAVAGTWHTLLAQCGIHSQKKSRPRIHDLRHTFAVHRLLQWYRQGEDVHARLPSLSTYMGHVDIRSTQIYLQATPELLEEAHQRCLNHYRKNIKPQTQQS